MSKAAEYRAKAELAEREARRMSVREHRDALLEIARHWRMLAEDRERITRSSSEPAGEAET